MFATTIVFLLWVMLAATIVFLGHASFVGCPCVGRFEVILENLRVMFFKLSGTSALRGKKYKFDIATQGATVGLGQLVCLM